MGSLLTVRGAVLSLLEKARGDKYAFTTCRVWLTLTLLQEPKECFRGASRDYLAFWCERAGACGIAKA